MDTKQRKQGWNLIHAGWYVYINAAGKELAYVERYRSFWNITILPMADQARKIELSASPKTLREAKAIAETTYRHQTIQALKAEAEKKARIAALGI